MEIEKLIAALDETVSYLKKSKSSDPSQMPIEEVIRRLEAEVAKAKNAKPMDVNFLDRLFSPNGVLQQTSIENGWGTIFLRISEAIDQFIGGK
jgi:hypothetical protein